MVIMATRKIPFVTDEYYHIYNRGVDKRIIFTNKEQLYYFFKSLYLLNSSNNKVGSLSRLNLDEKRDDNNLVDIVAYCLLPNHFHLLLKQKQDDGIVKFMQKLGTSYTMFFNKHEKRSGSLFQGRFQARHIKGDYSLPLVASYVNLNYRHHNIDISTNLVKSSIFEYFDSELGKEICARSEIKKVIAEIGSIKEYKQFAFRSSEIFTDNKKTAFKQKDFEF
jgi:REP element-mobilizing transposase RayT